MYLAQVTPRVTDSYRSHRIAKIVFYDNTHVVSDRTVSLQLLFMINQWLIFWGQKWKTCLLFLQFDKTVCRLLCFKVTDTWTITLLSRFQRLRNLLVLKFGLYIQYLEATFQLIWSFLNLCHTNLAGVYLDLWVCKALRT